MKLRIALLAAAAIACTSLPALAQNHVELNPFGGYLFGGTFDRGSNAIFNSSVDVADHETYGGRIGFIVNRWFEVELQYSHTATAFETNQGGNLFGPGNQKLGELNIDYYLAYGTFNFGHDWRFRGYFTIGGGGAHLDPHVANVSTNANDKFTASLGTGVKWMFIEHFGVRFDGRYYGTYLGNTNDNHNHNNSCSNNDFWSSCGDRTWLSNWDLNGGLVIAF